jgi:hypothetical protein
MSKFDDKLDALGLWSLRILLLSGIGLWIVIAIVLLKEYVFVW